MLGHRLLNADDYIAILKRRFWIIAVPTILLPLLALIAVRFIPKQYVSQTLVLIEQQKVPDTYVKPVISADIDERLASMREQILSRSRIQPIIERFDLYPNLSMDERLDTARKSIDIKPIHSDITRTGGLPGFFISFKAGDPHTAQQVCSEITTLFVGENLRAREQSAQGTTSFLQGQLAEAKGNLDAQDAKLADFQRQYVGKLPGEESPNLNMLTSLNTQLQAATQQLERMEQDKSYSQSLLAQQTRDPGLSPSTVGAPDERLVQLDQLEAQEADLNARYTPDYPDVVSVQRKISDLKKQIARSPQPVTPRVSATHSQDSMGTQQLRAQIQGADQGIRAKRAEQAALGNSIRLYQDRIQSSPLVEEQYKALTRDYQTAQKFYDDLLAKMNESKMATDLERRQQGEQFSVMDGANLPEAPLYPKPAYFGFGGLFAGLVLGLSIVAFLEYKNTALRTEQDVFFFTKLPTLAVIAYTPSIDIAEPSPRPSLLQRLRRTDKAAKMDPQTPAATHV